MYDYILDIGFDGYIGGNGAYIEYEAEVILRRTLTSEEEAKIVDWLHERGLEFYLESNSGLYASENFRERGKQPMIDYATYKGDDKASTFTVDTAFPDMIYVA